jgi:putative transport protein
MLELLIDNRLLLLFLVVAIGYPLGQLKIGGSSLGVAAVLFAGLAIGAFSPNLKIPEIVYQFGLVLFVYTVGLSSGPNFLAALRRSGLRDNLFTVTLLLLAALLTVGFQSLLGLKSGLAAGMFAGSLTNTPALASILEQLKTASHPPTISLDQLLAEPVIGYSITYPLGVIGTLAAIYFFQRHWRIDYAKEARTLKNLGVSEAQLINRTVEISNPAACERTLQELTHQHNWDVIFGRWRSHKQKRVQLAEANTSLEPGDLVSLIGTAEEIERVAYYLGQLIQERLELDRSELDYRRIFVSSPQLAGRRLADLKLPQQLGALITRIRRGDQEFLPHATTQLQLGDRVRVVAHPSRMEAVSAFFGDSYQRLSEINYFTFGLGLVLGLGLGAIPLPLPGGLTLKLGNAGGPLVVALVLGVLERSGPLVWNLPYNAILTLRQLGMILFLAGVGTRAGNPFVTTLTQGGASAIALLVSGAVITVGIVGFALWFGYRVLKIPMGLLTGMVAGVQTQPAVLSYALEQTDNDLPNLGYATVYPVAIIVKIVLAQILIIWLS